MNDSAQDGELTHLRVIGTAVLPWEDDASTPVLYVDAAARPDVTDLPRVFGQEGNGDAAGNWLTVVSPHGPRLRLTVSCTVPVHCEFTLELRWPEDRDFLRAIVDTGRFIIDLGGEEHLISTDVDSSRLCVSMAMAELGIDELVANFDTDEMVESGTNQ